MNVNSFDGARIHVTCMGSGRAVLLIHGLMSSAQVNWIDYGTAKTLADAGFHLIMPDLRGHGRSDVNCAYPVDVLRDDMIAVLNHFNIDDYDVIGYSLGARTAARLALTAHKPIKLVLAGMGYGGMIGTMERRDWFIHVLKNRDAPADAASARVISFLKTMKMDVEAVLSVLMSQGFTSEEDLQQLRMETLVLAGKDDHDNGSAAELAATLPHANYVEIPGNHMNAITRPEFGAALLKFLTDS